jgi:hypothetical protein
VKCRNFIRGLPRSYARGLSDSRSTRMWNKRFGTPGVERLKSFCGALDEVRVRVREQLLPGATQIKLTAGGGVASPHSPLDVSTFTEALRPPRTGAPTLPCTHTRPFRFSGRSPLA